MRALAGERTPWSPRGARPPRKHLLRRSTGWQQFTLQLRLSPDASPSVGPFAVTAFDVEVSTLLVRTAHWLRIEVRLPTGATGCSTWWLNDDYRTYLVRELTSHTTSRSAAVVRHARATITRLISKRSPPEVEDWWNEYLGIRGHIPTKHTDEPSGLP